MISKKVSVYLNKDEVFVNYVIDMAAYIIIFTFEYLMR